MGSYLVLALFFFGGSPPKKTHALENSALRVPRSSPYPACGTSGFRSDRRWAKWWRFLWGVKGTIVFLVVFYMEFPGSLKAICKWYIKWYILPIG